MIERDPVTASSGSRSKGGRVTRLAVRLRLRPARAYLLVGAALGLGAPIGFLALRRLFARAPMRRSWRKTRPDERAAYVYMAIATPIVFSIFGQLLGRQQEKLRASSEHIARLREEFAAVVAHDLRNPLTAILLRLDALVENARNGEVTVSVDVLHSLHRSGRRLASMVEDLLDASRIEAARLRLNRQLVSLHDSVSALVEHIRPTLGKHPIEIEAHGAAPLVSIDPDRLDQIVTNLLDNAAKYSPDGAPIRVVLRPESDAVVLSVEDHGWGIPQDEQARLFDRFYQAQRAREKKRGLGLGLYITKGLVEAHGGRIWVDSEPGRGSSFHVRLPTGTDRASAP